MCVFREVFVFFPLSLRLSHRTMRLPHHNQSQQCILKSGRCLKILLSLTVGCKHILWMYFTRNKLVEGHFSCETNGPLYCARASLTPSSLRWSLASGKYKWANTFHFSRSVNIFSQSNHLEWERGREGEREKYLHFIFDSDVGVGERYQSINSYLLWC